MPKFQSKFLKYLQNIIYNILWSQWLILTIILCYHMDSQDYRDIHAVSLTNQNLQKFQVFSDGHDVIELIFLLNGKSIQFLPPMLARRWSLNGGRSSVIHEPIKQEDCDFLFHFIKSILLNTKTKHTKKTKIPKSLKSICTKSIYKIFSIGNHIL